MNYAETESHMNRNGYTYFGAYLYAAVAEEVQTRLAKEGTNSRAMICEDAPNGYNGDTCEAYTVWKEVNPNHTKPRPRPTQPPKP